MMKNTIWVSGNKVTRFLKLALQDTR